MTLNRTLRNLAASSMLCVLLLGGCQATSVLNGLTPDDNYRLVGDTPYGPSPRQRFDLYLPNIPSPHRGIVVFVYGGAWDSGDKDQYRFVGQAFAELGYITAIPDYRLFPQATFPDFVDDVAQSIAAIGDHLPAGSCANGSRIILVGHSAGAYTAALLATDPWYLEHHAAGIAADALIGLAGPYDLPLDDPLVVGKFDRRPSDKSVNPVLLANPDAPPALLLHGARDRTVSPHHTGLLSDSLRRQGVAVTVRIYPEATHRSIIGALAKPLRLIESSFDDIAAYLRTIDGDQQCRDAA